MRIQTIAPALAVVAILGLTACSNTRDGTRGNPPYSTTIWHLASYF